MARLISVDVLDLDDVRAAFGQHLATDGHSDETPKFEHAQTFEGTAHYRLRLWGSIASFVASASRLRPTRKRPRIAPGKAK